MDTKQKYVRLKPYNEIIIFPCVLEHSEFKNFNPGSAGFCHVNAEKEEVKCFGDSYSLNMKSDPQDSQLATKQIFGLDAMLKLLTSSAT